MQDIAVCIQNENKEVNIVQTINAIAKSGYKKVFAQWYDDDSWEFDQDSQINLCKSLGLEIIFAHLGYQKINSIWLPGEEGDKQVERYKKDFLDCKERGISLVVMHLTSGNNAEKYNELGLKRIKELAEFAKSLDMRIAFENAKIKGYLEYVFENLDYDNLGICFDIGHYHVHFKDDFPFELFKNKIWAVHLHDNDQTDDLHLLPFDGTLEWKDTIKKLKDANYNGPITLELCYRYQYLNMPIEDFYKEGYKRGERVREIFEKV